MNKRVLCGYYLREDVKKNTLMHRSTITTFCANKTKSESLSTLTIPYVADVV